MGNYVVESELSDYIPSDSSTRCSIVPVVRCFFKNISQTNGPYPGLEPMFESIIEIMSLQPCICDFQWAFEGQIHASRSMPISLQSWALALDAWHCDQSIAALRISNLAALHPLQSLHSPSATSTAYCFTRRANHCLDVSLILFTRSSRQLFTYTSRDSDELMVLTLSGFLD